MTMYPSAPGTPENLRIMAEAIYKEPKGELRRNVLLNAAQSMDDMQKDIERLREELYTAHLELNSNGDDIICQCDDCEAYRTARTDISSPPATTFVANPFDLPESAASSGGDVHIDVSCGKVTPLPISLLKRLKAGEVLTYTHNDRWAVNGIEVALCKHGNGPICPDCAAESANSTAGDI